MYRIKRNEGILRVNNNFEGSAIPTCRSELRHHILRTTYIIQMWSHAYHENPVISSPIQYEWREEDDKYCFQWFEGDQLPSIETIIDELEHTIFIIQCYYRTGQKLENGEWVYSINRCIEEFQQQFPNLPVTYAQLLKQIQACVIKFGEIGAVTRKLGGGAPKKRTANLIEDVQQQMEASVLELDLLADSIEVDWNHWIMLLHISN
ncbi:neuropeptide y receptor [Holotrichia oblita]|uniref:Neuropeptide y receptor n=1 Tax=Holotrichia oblita TaxID=644536 RepID=A0ACB9TUC2_HOLOL|nr:neuropeptide y receptor [Holotrichia oblita]